MRPSADLVQPFWSRIATHPTNAALIRSWKWLTFVQTSDPVRYVVNRGFAYVITVQTIIAVLLVMLFVLSGAAIGLQVVVLLGVPMNTLMWWLNRRGTTYGATIYTVWCAISSVLGSTTSSYTGADSPVPLIFIFSIVAATLFIRPRAGLWALALQMGTAAVVLAFSDVPPERAKQFLIIGTLNLGAITVFLMVGATIFWRALRASIAANDALQQLNTDLEQRVAERTADLQAANRVAERARAVAEEANHFKTQFLANMSHELRTPLNAILNFTQFLADSEYGVLNKQQQMFQSRVLYNSEHLLGLINDILDLSKIEAGHMELDRELADLRPILQGVLSTAVGLTKEKNLMLTLDCDEQLPEVWMDKIRIRQVLLNLISNAAKFTNQGSITVRAIPTDDGFVQISVQDTGIGIAPEHQTFVFEEFRQVQSDLSRSYEGTGLGLPISKRLIELHGGRMWLTSIPAVGSTFFFTIPVVQGQMQRVQVEAPGMVADMPLIMIVDDDPDTQRIFTHLLQAAGYAVHNVVDSQIALAEIRRIRPALVILDLKMQPLDGWSVLAQIQDDPDLAELPVVICSIMDNDHERVGVLTNVTAYLHKPIRRDDLLAVIRRFAPPATILIVDDDSDTHHSLGLLLEKRGYRVVAATNGTEALARMAQAVPDLVLLDLMMPDMDGFEVLAHMRATPELAKISVIVVTAKDLTLQEHIWLRERTNYHFQKPVSSPMFLSIVDNLLKGARHDS